MHSVPRTYLLPATFSLEEQSTSPFCGEMGESHVGGAGLGEISALVVALVVGAGAKYETAITLFWKSYNIFRTGQMALVVRHLLLVQEV